jgi:uncharacterized membrane protein
MRARLTTGAELVGIALIAVGIALVFLPAGVIAAGIGIVAVCELLDRGGQPLTAADVARMIAEAQR